MTNFFSKNLKQTATYWALTGQNEYGVPTFASAVSVSCRWEDTKDLIIKEHGKEEQSNAIVYLNQMVTIGGYLYLGTMTGTTPEHISGAWRIRSVESVPSIKGSSVQLRMAIL